MRSKLTRIAYAIGAPLWWLLGWVVPKDGRAILINTFPDFDDSTRALANALRDTDRKLVVLTVGREYVVPEWLRGPSTSVAYRYSLRGVWLYHRSKFVLFTHGCFSAWAPSRRQVVVNIWHGMPIKNIGLLDGKARRDLPRFHLTIAADGRFQPVIASAFGVRLDQVLVADHPRLDVLRAAPESSCAWLPAHERLAVWMPTYRASSVGDVRVDGDAGADIFSGDVDLGRIDALCAAHGVLCVVKPHPMAKVRAGAFERYRSILLVDDGLLAAHGLSLYQLLAHSDFLITDVSSVYFDYKVLGRPVILYCPDVRRYAATRGFVAPIETLVTDEILQTEDALLAKLKSCFERTTPTVDASSSPEPEATLRLLGRIGA